MVVGKQSNDEQILNVIRRQGAMSRVEIAKITGLTPPTVTTITGKLIDLKLILEDSMGQSSGGRRPLLLKINSDIAQLIIIHIRSEKIIGYVIDPEFQVYHKEIRSINGMKEKEVLELMFEVIALCQQAATAPVPAIGVVVRGPVRICEGISVFAPNIGWKNMPLKKMIEDKTGIVTFVENDAKALTNGEYYYGAVKDADTMILLKVSHGIGGGIMLGGRMYRGINGSAGEVGHTTIDITGPLCSCGNYGCLESIASENALVDRVARKVAEGGSSFIYDQVNGELSKIDPDIIYQAANAGDPLAVEVLHEVAYHLGIGISNLVNIFNPKIIIMSGGIVKARHIIEDKLRQTVMDRAFESCSSVLDIRFSTSATVNTLKGMADMIFEKTTESVWLHQR